MARSPRLLLELGLAVRNIRHDSYVKLDPIGQVCDIGINKDENEYSYGMKASIRGWEILLINNAINVLFTISTKG